MSLMRIGERAIGAGQPPYVIAEIGVNHDGEAARARALVEAAARAGADAIKLQYFRADLLLSREAQLAAYQRAAGEVDPLAMLRRLELGLEDMARVVERAHGLGLHAIVTVFSLEHVEPVSRLAWDAFKTASPDLVHRPLLEALARDGRPMIVSTGAATLEEVERARGWLEPARQRLALLHCVSSYPTPPADAQIGAVAEVARAARGCVVGYSDHTAGVEAGAVAVGAGAAILEKHLTDDRGRAGPDHAASLEPGALREYIDRARAGGAAADPVLLGDGRKRVLECERDVRTLSRQSVAAARDLAPGQAIQRHDLTVRRPGTGLEPWRLGELLGRRVGRAVRAGSLLRTDDLIGLEGAA